MISFVQGTVDELQDGRVVIDVGGIGFEVLISGETAAKLSAMGNQEPVKLYTYMNVDREGVMSLIGFLSRDALSLFRLLITVNGVGPKAGLALLSAMGADELRFAIASGDSRSIARAPGVGKKTADRLVLELKDKLAVTGGAGSGSDGLSGAEGLSAGAAAEDAGSSAANEAVEALTALGYGRMEAVSAVRKARAAATEESGSTEADTETLLKKALEYIL